MTRWLDTIVGHAARSEEHEVRVEGDDRSLTLVIDDVVVMKGFPEEMFTVDLDARDVELPPDAEDLVEELFSERRAILRERKRDQEIERTATHRVAEGASLSRTDRDES